MNSLRLSVYSWVTRTIIKPWVKRVTEPNHLREAFERHAKRMHFHPSFAAYRNGHIGDVPVVWVSRKDVTRDEVLFYVHGGGFIVGSPDTHKHMVAKLAGDLGIEAVMPKYRLAPENPFPAGFDDVLAAYNGLVASGRRADQIVLGGDSAGGNLVLALLAHLSQHNEPMPQSAFLMSPLVTMDGTLPSRSSNASTEVLLPDTRFDEMSEMYLAGKSGADPLVSPLNAQFDRCPPILLHCCDGEILRDDTLEMQQKLVAQGHDVLVRSWPNAFHVFHIMHGHFPEAEDALNDVATFVKAHRSPNDS